MNLVLIKDTFSNKDNTKQYYVVRYALINEKKEVQKKGEIVIWLSEEQFNNYKI